MRKNSGFCGSKWQRELCVSGRKKENKRREMWRSRLKGAYRKVGEILMGTTVT